ncbi:MAG TPA: hypothetical protein VGM75_27195 [Pseudonocardiaceae bacterium]|jgi:hypothetical protein
MKLYARMLKAQCPVDKDSLEQMIPVLQDEIVPYAAGDPGFRQMFFFVDYDEEQKQGNVFSITIYNTKDDLDNAMQEKDSRYRFATLGKLGCTATDARSFEVVAGRVNPDVPEADFDAGHSSGA